jgi:hypothetical protein
MCLTIVCRRSPFLKELADKNLLGQNYSTVPSHGDSLVDFIFKFRSQEQLCRSKCVKRGDARSHSNSGFQEHLE